MGIRGGLFANAAVEKVTIEVEVKRADGRVEPMQTVAYWHKNPLRRWAWEIRKSIMTAVKGIGHGLSRPE